MRSNPLRYQEGTYAVPEDLPTPPIQPDTTGGAIIGNIANQLKGMIVSPEGMAAIRSDPTSLDALKAYGRAGLAAGAMLGGKGEEEPVAGSRAPIPQQLAQSNVRAALDRFDFDPMHAGHGELADDLSRIDPLPQYLQGALKKFDANPDTAGNLLEGLARRYAAPPIEGYARGTSKVMHNPLKYARGTDTVPAQLTPHEAVLNRNAAELAGRHNIARLNAMGNHLASKGIDLASRSPLRAYRGITNVRVDKPPVPKLKKFKPVSLVASPYATPKPLSGFQGGTDDVSEMMTTAMSRFVDLAERHKRVQTGDQPFTPTSYVVTTPQDLAERYNAHQSANEEARARAMNESPSFSFQDGSTDVAPDPSDPAYKQWLINKILSGSHDYTYGPGSPGATPSDMRQVTGSRNNPLTTGDIALPHKDYVLFTPAEREQYRIADTSWIKPGQPTPRGSVERYYGQGANVAEDQQDRKDLLNQIDNSIYGGGQAPAPTPTPTASPTSGYLAGSVPNLSMPNGVGAMSGANQAMSPTDTSIMSAITGLGRGISQQGQGQEQAAQSAMSRTIANVPTSSDLLQQLANDPLGFLRSIQAPGKGFSGFQPFG